jgi:hypothetical protein
MSIFEFPMVFPADGASLVGRVYRNVGRPSRTSAAVMVTASWRADVRTYTLRLAATAFTVEKISEEATK